MCHGFSTANLLIERQCLEHGLAGRSLASGEGSYYATALPETVAISAVGSVAPASDGCWPRETLNKLVSSR